MNGWKRRLESVRGAKSLLMYRSGKKYSREGSRTFNSVSTRFLLSMERRQSVEEENSARAAGMDGRRLIVGSFGCRPDFSKENQIQFRDLAWKSFERIQKLTNWSGGSHSGTMSESSGRARGIDSQFSFVVSRANIRCRKTRCLDHSFIGVITLEPLCRRELDCDIDGLTRSTRAQIRFDSIQTNEIE